MGYLPGPVYFYFYFASTQCHEQAMREPNLYMSSDRVVYVRYVTARQVCDGRVANTTRKSLQPYLVGDAIAALTAEMRGSLSFPPSTGRRQHPHIMVPRQHWQPHSRIEGSHPQHRHPPQEALLHAALRAQRNGCAQPHRLAQCPRS